MGCASELLRPRRTNRPRTALEKIGLSKKKGLFLILENTMHEYEQIPEDKKDETPQEETIRAIARVVIPYAGTEPAHEEPQIMHQVSEFRANLPA